MARRAAREGETASGECTSLAVRLRCEAWCLSRFVPVRLDCRGIWTGLLVDVVVFVWRGESTVLVEEEERRSPRPLLMMVVVLLLFARPSDSEMEDRGAGTAVVVTLTEASSLQSAYLAGMERGATDEVVSTKVWWEGGGRAGLLVQVVGVRGA